MKNTYLNAIVDRLRQHTDRVERNFGQLSSAQLNWKSSPESWSVGQCLDHMITTNATYFPVLKQVGTGLAEMGWWARLSPLSGFFGELLLRETGPQIRRKAKSPKPFAPTQGSVDPDICVRFRQHHQQLIGLLQASDVVDHQAFILPSPAAAMVTYRLSVAVQIIVQHEERHLLQAAQVLSHPSFPKA
jgi:uncharacterized damage-inducible protein DinB